MSKPSQPKLTSLWTIWSASQILFPALALGILGFQSAGVMKNITPIAALFLIFLFNLDKIRFNNGNLFWFILIFYLLLSAIAGIFLGARLLDTMQTFMIIVWIFAQTILAPVTLNDFNKIVKFARISFFVILICLIFGCMINLLSSAKLADFFSYGRLVLFFDNPLYLGGILFTQCFLAYTLTIINSELRSKIIWIIVCLLFFYLLLLTNARTFIIGFIIMFSVYSLFPIVEKFSFYALLFYVIKILFVLAIAILFSSFYLDIDFNKLSSGRVAIWEEFLFSKINAITMVVGGAIAPEYPQSVIVNDEEIITKVFNRLNVDNFFISFLAKYGVIGLSLFLLGLLGVYKKLFLLHSKCHGVEKNIVRLLIAAFWAVLIMSMFYEIFPSFGNVTNAIIMVMIFSVSQFKHN